MKKAVESLRIREVTQEQLKLIGGAKEETVNVAFHKKLDTAVEQSKSERATKSPSTLILCRYCGGKHHIDKCACPAYGKVCKICGKEIMFSWYVAK